jgi:hypothetical protein
MQGIVDTIASLVKSGRSFQDGDETSDVLEGYPCTLRTVRPEHYRDHVGYAMWFYKGASFPVLQCVWPDNGRRYPWHEDCQDGIRRLQPALYQGARDQRPSPDEGAG